MSGVAGVHGPAPEGSTDQRFVVCVAPFPGLELGHTWLCVSDVAVCVRRGWSPRTCYRRGHGSEFCHVCRSFSGDRVSPPLTLPYDNNRRALIAFFIFFHVSRHNLSRESRNSLDQISRESRLPGLNPNDDPPTLRWYFILDGNTMCLEPNQVVVS